MMIYNYKVLKYYNNESRESSLHPFLQIYPNDLFIKHKQSKFYIRLGVQ